MYLQAKGHHIINSVVGLYVAKVVADSAVGEAAGGLLNKIPGLGLIMKVISPFLSAAMQVATLLAIPLLIVGLTWAYYLPIIPFLFFTMAVIGTFIQFAEAIVAAPVWAAAHALPEGDGFAGNHGKQGYLLLFNILLRPPLLMVGFMLSIVMVNGLSKWIASGFSVYTAGMSTGQVNGPITYIALSVTFTVIITLALHKLFSLVTWLPDNIIRWVGQAAANLGEQASVDKGNMVFAGVMQQGVGKAAPTTAAAAFKGGLREKE